MAFDRRQAVQNHAAQLYGYAVSLCSDPTLAEDLAQETITKAIAARRILHDKAAFRAWMFRILRTTRLSITPAERAALSHSTPTIRTTVPIAVPAMYRIITKTGW